LWPFRDMPVAFANVRYSGWTGKHLLGVRISGWDPDGRSSVVSKP
jgi:hypothetical protein